jgi:hypothetical protein
MRVHQGVTPGGILDNIFDLQSEVARFVNECACSLNISINFPPDYVTLPEIYEDSDSCCFAVNFEILFPHKLMGFCSTVGSINHPGAQHTADTDIIALASKFDELFRRCGLLSSVLPEFREGGSRSDDSAWLTRLVFEAEKKMNFELQQDFRCLIGAQMTFLKLLLHVSRGDACRDADA